MDRLRLLTEHREIAAGVYQAPRYGEAAQRLQRPVDREALGNSSDIILTQGVEIGRLAGSSSIASSVRASVTSENRRSAEAAADGLQCGATGNVKNALTGDALRPPPPEPGTSRVNSNGPKPGFLMRRLKSLSGS